MNESRELHVLTQLANQILNEESSDYIQNKPEREPFGYLPGRTSEERNGVMPQPVPICLAINPVQEKVNEAISLLSRLRDSTSPMEVTRLIKDIEKCLSPIERELEEVRKQAANLRAWGEQWKKRAKLEQEIGAQSTKQ